MGSSSNGANTYLGRGRIYLDRKDSSGNSTGYRFVGTASKLEISQNPETVQMKDFSQAAAPVISRATIGNEIDINITLGEWIKENLALALLGSESSYTQAATAVTGETLTSSVVKDRHYKTAKRKITTVVVKQASTTLVLGTDYTIPDSDAGLIYILASSVTVTAGSAITVDYTPTAISTAIDKVIGGNSIAINCGLLYIGDPQTGPAWDYEFWKVNLVPDGNLSLIGDQYGEIGLKGVVLSDPVNHPTEPNFTALRKS